MASSSNRSQAERTPLLRQDTERPRAPRNVTFNPNPVTKTIFPEPSSLSSSPAGSTLAAAAAPTSNPFHQQHHGGSQGSSSSSLPNNTPFSAINSRLRRRNSHGSTPFVGLPGPVGGPLTKRGPQRSTKNAEKLKLLPNPDLGDDGGVEDFEESGRDVYSQYTRIKDPNARRDAARLGKADRERLPRVTAYCTANKYQMEGLMRFLKGRARSRASNPKLIDECIYSPYNYATGKGAERAEAAEVRTRRESQESMESQDRQDRRDRHEPPSTPTRPSMMDYERRHSTGQLTDVMDSTGDSGAMTEGYGNGRDAQHNLSYPSMDDHESAIQESPMQTKDLDFDTEVHTPEVFLFEYGVVVIWGMSPAHEQRFLKDIAKFEMEKLDQDDVETECFNFYYTREYQARIYNDFITLRDKGNYMTKLAISHALAQSVKTSLFEELLASTIETCKDIPTQIALTGKIAMSRSQINMQIGELFILRINIHLNGSVLDTPELFWVEPHLEPVYQAVRSYLEMDQRVGLLTERLDVIADLLAVLKGELSHGHGEMLEWIVIILIAAEILVAAVNIVVDLYAGVD
ncbi:DUF155-domain-containing protein [Apiospora arundinis]|uniref:DUF155-domain-containing protein n=1 Tax=Apiospora arundinis TaxID=335852 RepID=A0ABR2I348_9PEZI